MARNLSHNLKRFVAGVCALLLMAGTIPANTDFGGLFGGSSIVAKADYVDGTLFVGDTSVTSTITNGDGWSFDADNNTLTLNGANITQCDVTRYGIFYEGSSPLSIVLVGDNTIDISSTTGDCGIWAEYSLINISGTGKLTVKGKSQGIFGYNGVNFNGGTVDVEAETFAVNGEGITIGNATVTATATNTSFAYALVGDVKNSIAGKGWTNAEGTEGETAIAVSETGRNLMSYKKVQFTATAAPLSGNCGAQGDNVTYTLEDTDNDTNYDKLTISGTGAMANYDPAQNVPWNSIKDKIKTVVIGNGVTSIGVNAFFRCVNLTTVSIPGSVTSIGEFAFGNCEKLTSVSIPEGVTAITRFMFFGCEKLESITIPNSVTSIAQSAFYGCESLKTVTLTPPTSSQTLAISINAFPANAKVAFAEGNTRLFDGNTEIEAEAAANTLNGKTEGNALTWKAAPKSLAAGTKIYKGDSVQFGQNKQFYTYLQDYDFKGWLENDTICTLDRISYNSDFNGSSVYEFIFSYNDNDLGSQSSFIIRIPSSQLSITPDGLKVAGGDGTDSNPYYFEIIPAPKTSAVGTEIYVDDSVIIKNKSFCYDQDNDGVASGNVAYYSDTVGQLSEIKYENGYYNFSFSISGEAETLYISIKSPQLSNPPIGLKIIGGDGTDSNPYYFKMLFAPLEVTTTQSQVIKAGDKFKVGESASELDINYKPIQLSVSENTVFTVTEGDDGLVVKGASQDIKLPFTSNSAKTYFVAYYNDMLTFIENKVYNSELSENFINIGDVLAVGASFYGGAYMYFQGAGGTSYVKLDEIKYEITTQGLMQGDTPVVDFAGTNNAFVFERFSENDFYFNQTYIDLGPVVTTPPTAKENLKYNGEEQALVSGGTASDGAKMQYLVVPDGKKPATLIVSGNSLHISVPKVGAVYKPTGDSGIWFENYHIKYNETEYYSDSGDGNVYTYNGKTKLLGLGNNRAELPNDCDAIRVTSISDTAITVEAVKAADYAQAAYGDAATATNAGKYQVYYKAVKDDKSSAVGSVTATIAKVDPTVTTAPTAKENLKYNGEAQALVTEGTASAGSTMQYLVVPDGKNPDTEIVSGDQEKIYTPKVGAVYKPTGGIGIYFPNHHIMYNDKEYSSTGGEGNVYYDNGKTIIFGSGNNSAELPDDCDAIYVESISDTAITVKAVKAADYAYGDAATAINAGKYQVYYKAVRSDGVESEADHIDATIAKADPTVTTPPTAKENLKYNGEEQELINKGVAANGTMEYGFAEPAEVIGKGELYELSGNDLTVGKIFKPSDFNGFIFPTGKSVKLLNNNDVFSPYNGSDQSLYDHVNVFLNGITPTICSDDNTYTEIPNGCDALRIDGINGNTIEVTAVKSSECFEVKTWSATPPKGTNAGDYNVYYRVKGNDNYNDIAPAKIENVKIAEAEITGVTLTANEPTAVEKSGNRVRASFSATVEEGYEIVEYNIIYANDGTVTDTSELTVGKVDGTTIKTFTNSTYAGLLLDKGNGVIAVGYVKVKDSNNNEFYVYTTDLGGKYAELKAKEATTLTANEPTAVERSGNRVRASFSAKVEEGYEIVEYNIIYANDGTVTDTSELTFDKVNGTTIKTFTKSTYSGLLLDKGNGVIAVGYVKVKDSNDNEFYVYTTDLGGKFAELNAVN